MRILTGNSISVATPNTKRCSCPRQGSHDDRADVDHEALVAARNHANKLRGLYELLGEQLGQTIDAYIDWAGTPENSPTQIEATTVLCDLYETVCETHQDIQQL